MRDSGQGYIVEHESSGLSGVIRPSTGRTRRGKGGYNLLVEPSKLS